MKSYLLMSWEELKIGSFICQGQKTIAEVVGLRHMIKTSYDSVNTIFFYIQIIRKLDMKNK